MTILLTEDCCVLSQLTSSPSITFSLNPNSSNPKILKTKTFKSLYYRIQKLLNAYITELPIVSNTKMVTKLNCQVRVLNKLISHAQIQTKGERKNCLHNWKSNSRSLK